MKVIRKLLHQMVILIFFCQLSGNRFCDEKSDWLESHKESATVDEIYKQKYELEELLKPMLNKLEDAGIFLCLFIYAFLSLLA